MKATKLGLGSFVSAFIVLGLLIFPKSETRADGGGGSRWEASYCWCDCYETSCTLCNYPSQYGCSAPELCPCCWISCEP